MTGAESTTSRSCLPTLRTKRLTLRGLRLDDAPALQEICSEYDIARPTCSIPHPYPEGAAEKFIRKAGVKLEAEIGYIFAIERIEDRSLVGTVGLEVDKNHNHAEIGFILGKKFWGNGYATEGVARVIRWGLFERDLHRIFGHCMDWNQASARVMVKAGMKAEGTLREHFLKWGQYQTAHVFGVVKSDLTNKHETNE